MVDLAAADIARREGQLPAEKEGDGEMAPADHAYRDRLSPANVGGGDRHLHVRRIEAGGVQFDGNPVAHDGVILAAFAGDSSPDRGGRLLAYPDMDTAAEFDNAKQNRQQHEGDHQDRLKG